MRTCSVGKCFWLCGALVVAMASVTVPGRAQPAGAPPEGAAPSAVPAAPAPAAPAEAESPQTAESPPGAPVATSAPEEAASADAAGAPPDSAAQQGAQDVASDENAAEDAASGDTDAALKELAAVEAAQDISGEQSSIAVYGFADFTYSHLLSNRHYYSLFPHPFPSFYVGNLNLYLDAHLSEGWRSLAEVRFTYLPHGTSEIDFAGGTFARTSTSVPDYMELNRPIQWGGVVIERAWIEYQAHALLTARFGQWLTPYGIWNVDHGSPVILGTRRPYMVASELLPQRQTGIELYGTESLDTLQLGYHLTLSNGRGPVDSYMDLDKNKAMGWRLWIQNDSSLGTVVFGTSGYRGRYTERSQVYDFADEEEPVHYPISTSYDELGVAADFKWTWGGFLLQGEAALRDQGYADEYRPVDEFAAMDGGPQGWTSDNRSYGFYALTGYRFPWLGVMPFITGEYFSNGPDMGPVVDAAAILGGFNLRPTDRVVLKLEVTHAWFPTDNVGFEAPKPIDFVDAQIAWSF
ncbi:MAG: hypothetical protein JW940_05100 [Polyangiaceae bacterium]|nr:hypothetical protein [Polyangiaceae bacterium]